MLSHNSNSVTLPTTHSTPPSGLADRADKAVQLLFGHDAPLTRAVQEVTRSLRHDIQRLNTGQATGPATLALIGRVGEGKSWIARNFIKQNASTTEAIKQIQSGQNSSQRSMKLTWIGDQHPFGDLDVDERFVKISPQNLLDLGTSYIVADTPGYSDHDPSLEKLSSRGLMSANVKLLATSVSHIRDASLAQFIGSMDGSLILPIIRFRPNKEELEPTEAVKDDCMLEMQQWHQHAPLATILSPIFVPDAGIAGEEAAQSQLRAHLSATLTPLLEKPETLVKHRESQLQQRIERARSELAKTLEEFRQRMGTPVERIQQLSRNLPETIQKEVLGDQAQLTIGIRSRFRADAIERTPALLFPYRSLVGLLGLTQGAWDRVVFTALGSMPSLVMTAFHSVKSWSKTRDFEKTIREQSHQRIRSLLNDAYRDDIKNFSHALTAITHEGEITQIDEAYEPIDVKGLAGIEIESQQIISATIQQNRISGVTIWLGGLLAFTLFWAMLLGPATALYTHYFSALSDTAQTLSKDWSSYPTPPASMWMTSVMLSLIPVGVIAMLVIHITCQKRRVRKASREIQQAISHSITERVRSEKITLVIHDPKLNAAKTLLNMSK